MVVSELCFDKVAFKLAVEKIDINVPPGEVVDSETIASSEFINTPFVLKPINGGSSLDTYVVRNPQESYFDQTVFERHENMLIEKLIEGLNHR